MSSHGTHSKYSRGCRCDECKAGHREYTANRRKAALAEGTLSHGRASTYDAGCRCDKCRMAKQVIHYLYDGRWRKGPYRPRLTFESPADEAG